MAPMRATRHALAGLCLLVSLGALGSDSGLSLDADQRERLRQLLRAARSMAGRPHPDVPLYAGLPDTLKATLPEAEGFVQFPSMVPADEIPLGTDWTFDPPRDMEALLEEEGWAKLPPGEVIRRRRDAAGRVVWDYPAGTRLMHRLYVRSAPERSLFEARYIEKRPDGTWAMGLYAPAGPPRPLAETGPLALNTRDDAATAFEVALGTVTVKVSVQRLPPHSCRHCHYNMGEGGYQYPDEEHTGPCGFVPANARLTGEWAAAYRRRWGASPFGPEPASTPAR